MTRSIAIVTLGVDDLDRSRRFYVDGFGWTPTLTDPETALYQLEGLVLSTWSRSALGADIDGVARHAGGAITLAHAVSSADEVDPLLRRLCAAGGRLLRAADEPPHGGRRGYVADPDGHVWEVLWSAVWLRDPRGGLTLPVPAVPSQ